MNFYSVRLAFTGFFILLGLLKVSAATFYVDLNCTNPNPPYASWAAAATNIQDAVDASTNGDLVLVTNGVYAAGGRSSRISFVTNRVTVTNAVTVQSVNGPGSTVIQGYQVPGTVASTNAVRCVQLGNGAFLSGFTITNGEAGIGNDVNGGGVAGSGFGAVISNCVVIGNICGGAGGGAVSVTALSCVFVGNLGGGGGATDGANLVNCFVTNNSAGWAGGVLGCKATNCLFANNSATNYGGASGFSTLVNCTVTGNSLQAGHGGNGGGSYNDTVFNCIVYNNTAPNGSNYYSSGMAYCCTAPLPAGTGNFANAPSFVNQAAGDFHLQSNSPCINSGNNAYVSRTNGLDGNPRIAGGTVDVGAYEFQSPASRISYLWLQQYNLPINTNTDLSDPDGNGMNNWQEWIAGTDPTNPSSLLKMLAPSNGLSGVSVNWQSVSGRTYFLQCSTNLGARPAFSAIQSNIVGQTGITSVTDTNAAGLGPRFYRVGVQ
jgi:hypothetical protein